MANPYSSAMSRYTRIKSDPLTYLEKEIRIFDLKDQINRAGKEAIIAICGVVLFRSLNRLQKDDVMQRIQNLIDSGYRELGGRLRPMIAGLIAFPHAYVWAMSIGELKKMATSSADVKDWISKTGLNVHLGFPSVMTLGTALWLSATEGPTNALIKMSNTDMAQAVGKRMGKQLTAESAETLAKGTGVGFVLLVIIMTGLYEFADIDQKRSEKEGIARGAYYSGWIQ